MKEFYRRPFRSLRRVTVGMIAGAVLMGVCVAPVSAQVLPRGAIVSELRFGSVASVSVPVTVRVVSVSGAVADTGQWSSGQVFLYNLTPGESYYAEVDLGTVPAGWSLSSGCVAGGWSGSCTVDAVSGRTATFVANRRLNDGFPLKAVFEPTAPVVAPTAPVVAPVISEVTGVSPASATPTVPVVAPVATPVPPVSAATVQIAEWVGETPTATIVTHTGKLHTPKVTG